jgi:hypothetical protein
MQRELDMDDLVSMAPNQWLAGAKVVGGAGGGKTAPTTRTLQHRTRNYTTTVVYNNWISKG